MTNLEKALFARLAYSFHLGKARGGRHHVIYWQGITGTNPVRTGSGTIDTLPDVAKVQFIQNLLDSTEMESGLCTLAMDCGLEFALAHSFEADILQPEFVEISWLTPERRANASRKLSALVWGVRNGDVVITPQAA